MEIEVATLMQIIGEQHVQILLLERQVAGLEAVEEPTGLTPVSDEDLDKVRGMFGNG